MVVEVDVVMVVLLVVAVVIVVAEGGAAPALGVGVVVVVVVVVAVVVVAPAPALAATALLRTLHWLPVKARIQYKIARLCFQCIYENSMPPYISDLLHPYCPSRTLRSLDTSLLTVSRFSLKTFGKRSFSVFGPTVWNSLPLSLRKTMFCNGTSD